VQKHVFGGTLVKNLLMFIAVSAVLPAATVQSAPGVLPAGTHISVRLAQSLDTRRDAPGTPFVAHVASPVVHNGVVVVPRGAVCHGQLVNSKASGRLRGRAVLTLRLDSITVGGQTYAVSTSAPSFTSQSHKKRNALAIGGTAGTGAAIGAIAGGGVGALVGAGAGAAAGTAGAAITGKRQLHLPAESRVSFTLRAPVRVRA
jgi:hypothetical protein